MTDESMSDRRKPLSVASWNVWAIPFASHALLSRPRTMSAIAAEYVRRSSRPGRTVICLQEAWTFKCGLGLPFLVLARFLERTFPSWCTTAPTVTFNPRNFWHSILRVNSKSTLVALISALVSSFCLPVPWFLYDGTKKDLASSARAAGLPFAVGLSGTSGMSWLCSKLMDSGLLIVSSDRPIASGFTAFDEPLSEESSVNKGMLWALFDNANGGSELIVNTHMHATSAGIRAAQRRQLACLLTRLRAEYRPAMVVVCGDFNESAVPPSQQKRDFNGKTQFTATEEVVLSRGLHADLTAPPLNLVKLSDAGPEGTCIKDDGSGDTDELDHIYATVDTAAGLVLAPWEAAPPLRHPLSDHSLIAVHGICATTATMHEQRI